MRKFDQSVLSTILSAVVTLALLVVANRPPSGATSGTSTATPPLGGWASLVATSTGVLTRASEMEPWGQATAGQKLGIGAEIQTDETATAQIGFEPGAVVKVAPYTTLAIADLTAGPDDPVARLRLITGKIWVSLRTGGMEVATRGGSAAVRGSSAEFEYRQGPADDVSQDVMVVRCLEGTCAVQSQTQPLVVLGNLQAIMLTFNGQPPVEIALGSEAVAAFIQNNPGNAALAPALTAAAPSAALDSTVVANDPGNQANPNGSASLVNPDNPGGSIPSEGAVIPLNTSVIPGTPQSPVNVYVTTTPGVLVTARPSLTRTPTRPSGTASVPAAATATPRPTVTLWVYPTPVWWSWTRTPTHVPTITFTRTKTRTVTPTGTVTPTSSMTPTVTATPTATPTISGTVTATLTASPSATGTATVTHTPTVTPTPTPTPTQTLTSAPTDTPTPTGTATETPTPTETGSPTPTSTETATPTPTATNTSGGFVVNNAADGADAAPGNGICETASGNGQCTLRAAVQEANALGGPRTITLSAVAYPLTLTGAGEDAAATGDLDITGDITIVGAGAGSTTIDASGLGDRVFQVMSLTARLQLSGVTVQNGNLASGDGGGIANAGTLVMNDSVLAGNRAAAGQGGGLFTAGGSSATLNRVWVNGNMAGSGGGIAALGDATNMATLDLNASAITGNTAVNNSTAIFTDRGSGNLINVTVSGNISGTLPAVLLASPAAGPLVLTNVTIANNYVGLANSGGIVRAANTIFANNSSANCAGTINSLGHNLDSAGSCALGGSGDNSNVSVGLDSLGNYGGSTPTHRLQSASPARDTGDNGQCPATDQRGVSRPQNGTCDVGAVEYQPGVDGP